MKTIYEAEDGKHFDNEEACRAYESRITPRLYDSFGDVAYDTNCAKYVMLPSKEATKEFIDLCEKENAEYEGINEYSLGLYFWVIEEQKYVEIDVEAMLHVIEQERGN